MIEVRRISHTELIGSSLLAEYVDECSVRALGEYEPCWELYAALEASGKYHLLGVYADEVMVGFCGFLTMLNPHCGYPVATVESIFVVRAHRGHMVGARLMRATEAMAKTGGCKAILYSAPAGGRLEAALGKRHPRANSVFVKPLDNARVDGASGGV